jgi:hypothetical protein
MARDNARNLRRRGTRPAETRHDSPIRAAKRTDNRDPYEHDCEQEACRLSCDGKPPFPEFLPHEFSFKVRLISISAGRHLAPSAHATTSLPKCEACVLDAICA